MYMSVCVGSGSSPCHLCPVFGDVCAGDGGECGGESGGGASVSGKQGRVGDSPHQSHGHPAPAGCPHSE